MSNYNYAKEQYAKYGIDTEKAIAALANVPVSVHCWQGDDVVGFDCKAELSGGICCLVFIKAKQNKLICYILNRTLGHGNNATA